MPELESTSLLRKLARTGIGTVVAVLVVTTISICESEPAETRREIVGEAILSSGAYEFLETITNRFGPRMIGSKGHRLSMDYLEAELKALGIETERQAFRYPGWERGEASVSISYPIKRELRAIELGYVGPYGPVEGRIEYVDTKNLSEVLGRGLEGRILLLKPNLNFNHNEWEELAEAGVSAALLINRVNGGQLLARTSNHDGHDSPLPILSITAEEGMWIQRLVEEEGEPVEVIVETSGKTIEMEGTNLIATLPGKSDEMVVLGGHFDSWDLGQGAIDNGLGVAQLFDAARILKRLSSKNRHTIKFVWFDAEEFGLWGSRHFVETIDPDQVRVMLNLDMVGSPIAINAMGFDHLVNPLESFSRSLGGWAFEKPVANKTWLGSDHHPFILKGIPAVTFNAPLDHDDARYYHDFADTLDKIDREMLARASSIVTLFMYKFSNDSSEKIPTLEKPEVINLLQKAGVDKRMKRSGQWPFSEGE